MFGLFKKKVNAPPLNVEFEGIRTSTGFPLQKLTEQGGEALDASSAQKLLVLASDFESEIFSSLTSDSEKLGITIHPSCFSQDYRDFVFHLVLEKAIQMPNISKLLLLKVYKLQDTLEVGRDDAMLSLLEARVAAVSFIFDDPLMLNYDYGSVALKRKEVVVFSTDCEALILEKEKAYTTKSNEIGHHIPQIASSIFGKYVITNLRIVFLGREQCIQITPSKIVSVEDQDDVLVLVTDTKHQTLYFLMKDFSAITGKFGTEWLVRNS